MWLTDGHVELGSQALILVLAATLAALCWGFGQSLLVGALAVVAFNLAFVAPRGTLGVDLHQHGLLLLTMLVVTWTVTALVSRLRQAIALARLHARRSDELRALGATLRQPQGTEAMVTVLKPLLDGASPSGSSALLIADDAVTETEVRTDAALADRIVGDVTALEAEGLHAAIREGQALGPGTGRFDAIPGLYLPLRASHHPRGAALLRLQKGRALPSDEQAHLQALCDLVGAAIERAAAEHHARQALEASRIQALRNTLLSAIAHDYRTPLATIVSAADALERQAPRLQPRQIGQLALTIGDEAKQLARITDNTLQLARLETLGSTIPKDWESLEELVGTVVRRTRQRHPGARIEAAVAPGIPLVRCDAVLIVQLLENLVDNALKYAGEAGPVTLFAFMTESRVVLGVEDQGPGIAAAQRERIFERFTRGADITRRGSIGSEARRGAGVGLALCRAIARAHDGELTVAEGTTGGARFALTLPAGLTPGGLAGPDGPGAPAAPNDPNDPDGPGGPDHRAASEKAPGGTR